MENKASRLADAEFLKVLAEAQKRHDHAAKLFMSFATMHLKSGLQVQQQIDAEKLLLDRSRLRIF